MRTGDAVGIVGLGLIGGSLAKAFRRRYPKRALIAVEPNAKIRRMARRDGFVEVLSPRPTSALSRCSLVVLCVPIDDVLHLMGPVSALMRDGAILTDVAGVKEPVLEAALSGVRPGVAFVGTHPMLGGESGGYAASRGELWKGGTVAVCTDGPSKRAVSEVVRLHRTLGARVVLCTAAEHDAAAAAISHLPYLLASALALTAQGAGALAHRLSARGLADATRLAAFPYEVQGEAARRNTHLVYAVRSFGGNLRSLLDALAGSPTSARIAFGRARAAKASLGAASARRG